MSFADFQSKLLQSDVGANDRKYFPKWIKRYLGDIPIDHISITRDAVIQFCRSLLDSRTPAWQRLQAVRALETYRDLILHVGQPDLRDIRKKLNEIAAREKKLGTNQAILNMDRPQDIVGPIDPTEPDIIQECRRTLRLHYKRLDTERAYIGWIKRFLKHCQTNDPNNFAEVDIKEFLTKLAVDRRVAPNTQNQAKSALLFLFKKVLGRDMGFIDAIPAFRKQKLPVVLSRQEIARLIPHFEGQRKLMFGLLYGAGLRHRECQRLRIKDICLDEGQIIVRDGKGEKDRITVLPDTCRSTLTNQIIRVKSQHKSDLALGSGTVYLPNALAEKYPNAAKEIGWQWLFPSHRQSLDPRAEIVRRHHVSDRFFATFFKSKLPLAGILKNASPHCLRSWMTESKFLGLHYFPGGWRT